jgi:hypothetical protein
MAAESESAPALTPRKSLLLDVARDLKVTFDDGTSVDAHALILVLASPVFRDLLTDDDGGMKKELHLPGKSGDEFTTFVQALLPASLRFHDLTDEATYLVLCRWAHEYEVDALRTLCEDHLLKSVAVSEDSLEHALTYKLERRRDQCLAEMKQDLPRFAHVLGQLAVADNARQLAELWPLLCTAANVDTFEMPPVDEVRVMWPFVVSAIRKQDSVTALTGNIRKIVTEQVAEVTETASSWNSYLYTSFWTQADLMQNQFKSMLTL